MSKISKNIANDNYGLYHYRTHYCAEIGLNQINSKVKVSGWVFHKRLHGSLLFIDVRDSSGVLQCAIEKLDTEASQSVFEVCDDITLESVITIEGMIKKRPAGKENADIDSGAVEMRITSIQIISKARELPFMMHQSSDQISEELRLKYRFLDMRRSEMQEKLKLRANVLCEIRLIMEEMGFIEVHTPFLTSSSPEGARDYVIPSRLHKGKFYALPQSPQQFKQLLMVAGIEKYYQIAPCFRDEDARADRACGAFYQLDLEMAFATQEDVLQTVEKIISRIFAKFSKHCYFDKQKFASMTHAKAMLHYGTDKPDLRNPLKFIDFRIQMHAAIERNPNLKTIFNDSLRSGYISLMTIQDGKAQTRKFFDNLRELAIVKGAKDMGYIIFHDDNSVKGSLAKLLDTDTRLDIQKFFLHGDDTGILIAHPNKDQYYQIISALRQMAGKQLDLINESTYKFCWITDFPMYEENDKEIWDFAHNPFSMPKNIEDIDCGDLSKIVGMQYDLVCNGYELASGAVRNHSPHLMYKVFEAIGLNKAYVDTHFSGMISAFNYGAPPHAGIAPGIERMIMLLAEENNVREVIPFPLTQGGLDLLMGAPSEISPQHWSELGILKKHEDAKVSVDKYADSKKVPDEFMIN